ncbi:phosphonate C-P lyase system protein PhnH [Pseudophaeobacter flagellatus]|uniref:phosphonate C-P lyase system protein PhnH n=1 Tax=Pseudophaeobacter flagellatus TaxID=2899119 RepID=UPI001E331D29|nr:phosphonate C-P lyase system protein PhnH [Pseudophaeobacter flagellatus]MCD9149137.1 phosphonate C-P lyase system protein PhnH [Pseudophaeobacter flagellatus]
MPQLTETTAYGGGFSAPAQQAAQAFRAAMTALARPGTLQDIAGGSPPAGISPAAGGLLLTLCDPETGVYLAPDVDSPELRAWLAFHTGAPIVAADQADFALGSWAALMPVGQYRVGTSEYPDRSATLIVEMAQLIPATATLTGPGIKERAELRLPDVAACQANAKQFPLGVDFFFTCGGQLTALPRSTTILPKE